MKPEAGVKVTKPRNTSMIFSYIIDAIDLLGGYTKTKDDGLFTSNSDDNYFTLQGDVFAFEISNLMFDEKRVIFRVFDKNIQNEEGTTERLDKMIKIIADVYEDVLIFGMNDVEMFREKEMNERKKQLKEIYLMRGD